MLPLNLLPGRSNLLSLDKLSRELGMGPLNSHLLKDNSSSWAKLPRELGIVPVRLLIKTVSMRSFDMTEMLGGIVQGEVVRAKYTSSLVTSPRLLIAGKVP